MAKKIQFESDCTKRSLVVGQRHEKTCACNQAMKFFQLFAGLKMQRMITSGFCVKRAKILFYFQYESIEHAKDFPVYVP